VQIEVWDRFDYTATTGRRTRTTRRTTSTTRSSNPGSPEYPDHPGQNKQPFFFTTPEQRNNASC
jgi:hypothetical protein